MKKSLIALAALAAFGTASAQSTVTISGSIAASFQKDLSSTAAATTLVTNNTAVVAAAAAPASGPGTGLFGNDATITISGVEDLGGGLKTNFSFSYEASGLRGNPVTDGDRTLGISGGFGAVSYSLTRSSNLMGTISSSAIALPDSIYDSTGILSRSDVDVLQYTLPTIMPGLVLSVSHATAEGNVSVATTNSSTMSYTARYTQGPVALAVAMKTVEKPTSTTKKSSAEASLQYNAGMAVIGVGYSGATTTAATGSAGNTLTETNKAATAFTLHIPMGAFSIGAEQMQRGAQKHTAFGGRYDFSKRTSFSASSGKQTYDQVTTATAAQLAASGNQYRLRLNHTF